jgi:hypothetical protein
MSQTATLSDFTRTSCESDAGFCAFETEPKLRSALSATTHGLWELAVTAVMLVLAPVILIALAAAFVVACLRMHVSEVETDAETGCGLPPASLPCVKQGDLGGSRGRDSFDLEVRSRLPRPTTSEHLWN